MPLTGPARGLERPGTVSLDSSPCRVCCGPLRAACASRPTGPRLHCPPCLRLGDTFEHVLDRGRGLDTEPHGSEVFTHRLPQRPHAPGVYRLGRVQHLQEGVPRSPIPAVLDDGCPPSAEPREAGYPQAGPRHRLHKRFGMCKTTAMTPTPNSTAAVLYCRVSTEEQGATGASLDAQETTLRAEAARRGITDVHVIRDVASGKTMNGRPGLDTARHMLKTRQAGYLFALRLDRISRDVHDFTGLMKDAARQRWAIVLTDMDIDASTPSGEFMLNIHVAAAQNERRLIGERTREGMAQRKREGVHIGRKRALSDDVARRIFDMRDEGQTVAAIARTLTEEKIPTATGKTKWYSSTVNRVLDSVSGRPA